MAANKLIVWLLLACAGSVLAQESRPTVRHHRVAEDPAAAAVVRAEAAMDNSDYAAAEAALQEAVQLDPHNYRAWYDLGVVYNATGRAADAVNAYRKSIAAYPQLFESNFNLGVLLARTGNPEAASFFRAATRLTPTGNREQGLAKAWMSLGYLLQGKERLDAFRRASELQPKDIEAHLQAAQAAESLHDLAAAEREYQAALALDPASSDAMAGLASVYLRSRRLPAAEDMLRKYLGLAPDSAAAHLQLGRVFVAEGKTDQAEPEFATALRLAPGDSRVERELAMLYADRKQFAQAEQHYRAVLQKDPGDPELHHRLGAALLQQKKFSEAQNEFQIAISLRPDYALAYGDLAFAASENRDYVLTLKALDERARFLPEIPATLFLRATAYDHLGTPKLAAACYRRFLAAAAGKFPEQEWQARHRLIAIDPKK